ncbi:hypothetical protein PoB_003578100 [Plakobranchus ocellatus]|uniref:Uncharacterized protein n=1 Tax=Plakobranchus ocellatus TaxID=259542 RepID=A0AAV4AM47_9GAST|nr:hypothetical protein PoB_003578100 [Plakobranchus ocellatus]
MPINNYCKRSKTPNDTGSRSSNGCTVERTLTQQPTATNEDNLNDFSCHTMMRENYCLNHCPPVFSWTGRLRCPEFDKPVNNKVISGFQAFCQAKTPVAALEPAIEGRCRSQGGLAAPPPKLLDMKS